MKHPFSSPTPEVKIDYSKNDQATILCYDMLKSNVDGLRKIMSLGYHLSNLLENKNENKFVVPSQIDRNLSMFGFVCEEMNEYDLSIPNTDYTISDKLGSCVFHQERSKHARPDNIRGGLMMSNLRPVQSNDVASVVPIFDCLFVMQHTPYISCGVSPYYKVLPYFSNLSGGIVLKAVPLANFKFIISPSEYMEPLPISPKSRTELKNFISLQNGDLFKKCLRHDSHLDNWRDN